jgi:hypothetical protein
VSDPFADTGDPRGHPGSEPLVNSFAATTAGSGAHAKRRHRIELIYGHGAVGVVMTASPRGGAGRPGGLLAAGLRVRAMSGLGEITQFACPRGT